MGDISEAEFNVVLKEVTNKQQTDESLKRLIGKCKFRDWYFRFDHFSEGRPYVQCIFFDDDAYDKEEGMQRCAKHALSYYMSNTEVIRTLHAAVIRALKHEADENFTYKDRRIFNPHRDIEALWEISNSENVDIRRE